MKLFNWLKPKPQPQITVNESHGVIFVYSDNELIIKATVYPLRDEKRIEQVTNLLKLLK